MIDVDEAPPRVVHFRVFAPEAWVAEYGCSHTDEMYPDVCRPCSVTQVCEDAAAGGHATFTYDDEMVHPEFRVPGRLLWGEVYDDVGRWALTRVLALLHGHPEPVLPHAR